MKQKQDRKQGSKVHQELESDIFQVLQKLCILGAGLVFLPSILAYQWVKNKPLFLLEREKGLRVRDGLLGIIAGLTLTAICYDAIPADQYHLNLLAVGFALNLAGIGGLVLAAEKVWYGNDHQGRVRVDDLRRRVHDFSPVRMQYQGQPPREGQGINSSVKIGMSLLNRRPAEILQKSRNMHSIFAGGSGFGKTTLMKTFLISDIRNRLPVVIIDAKGSQKNIDEFKQFAQEQGLPPEKFYVFSISNPSVSDSYNPLKNGTVVEKQDRLFAALDWSEVFYQSQATAYLSKLFPVLSFYKQKQIKIGDLREFMTDSNYRIKLGKGLDQIYQDPVSPKQLKDRVAEARTELSELEKWDSKVIAGLRAQLVTIDKDAYG